MNVPTRVRAFAVPAVLGALCALPVGGRALGQESASDTALGATIATRSNKPALMAWNRKRSFLIVNKEGQRLGELTDFVIDRTTGRLSHSALKTETDPAQTKAFPVSELQWEADTQRFRSRLTASGIASLPDFSPEWLERLELGTQLVVEAGHTKRSEPELDVPRFVLAGDVEGAELTARDGPVGSGLGVILDMNPGEAAYLLLSSGEHRGGELHPVPWNALVPTAAGGYGVDKSRAEMVRAPAISKELIASLTMPGFRQEIAEFYGVPSRIDARLERIVNKSGS